MFLDDAVFNWLSLCLAGTDESGVTRVNWSIRILLVWACGANNQTVTGDRSEPPFEHDQDQSLVVMCEQCSLTQVGKWVIYSVDGWFTCMGYWNMYLIMDSIIFRCCTSCDWTNLGDPRADWTLKIETIHHYHWRSVMIQVKSLLNKFGSKYLYNETTQGPLRIILQM